MIKIPDDIIFKAFKVLMDPASGALLAEKVIKITDDDSFKASSPASNGMDSILSGSLKGFYMEWIFNGLDSTLSGSPNFSYGMDSTRCGSLKSSAEHLHPQS